MFWVACFPFYFGKNSDFFKSRKNTSIKCIFVCRDLSFLGKSFLVGNYRVVTGWLPVIRNQRLTLTEAARSGFFVQGEVRDMAIVKTSTALLILVARNNDNLKVFELNKDN